MSAPDTPLNTHVTSVMTSIGGGKGGRGKRYIKTNVSVASVKLDFSTAYAPQHIHAVENTNICCGQHKKNVTHSISSPTGYAMSGFCPQHIPTIYVRSPQYICTHKLYLHSIHPQYKRRSPQHSAGMDTRTGYLMLSTIYV